MTVKMELQYNFVDYNRQYRFIFISVEVRRRHQTEDLGRIQHFGMCACVCVCVCVCGRGERGLQNDDYTCMGFDS